MPHPQIFLIAGALYGATGVLLGAFGAHALASRLEGALRDTWETAVTYQLVHALALLIVGVWGRQSVVSAHTMLIVAGWSFMIGILLFSGSLYTLALHGPRILGPVTPLGGVAFVLGWLALAGAALRH